MAGTFVCVVSLSHKIFMPRYNDFHYFFKFKN